MHFFYFLHNYTPVDNYFLTKIGVLVALSAVILQVVLWFKDRYDDKNSGKNLKKLLTIELRKNFEVAECDLNIIDRYLKGEELQTFGGMENQIFKSILNSHSIVRFLSWKIISWEVIEKLLNYHHTVETINGLIGQLMNASSDAMVKQIITGKNWESGDQSYIVKLLKEAKESSHKIKEELENL